VRNHESDITHLHVHSDISLPAVVSSSGNVESEMETEVTFGLVLPNIG